MINLELHQIIIHESELEDIKSFLNSNVAILSKSKLEFLLLRKINLKFFFKSN